ncbi:MAG: conjugal transfer protein TraG [Sphingobacteriaceae bacterium]|nr:MAG: conjugal transfer protein TraG [Sphingobacteriaceae bacterium]
MDLTIYTYGYYDALYYTLNGLAMFRQSIFYTSMVETTALIVGIYHAMRMASSNWQAHAIKVIGMVVLINGLLMPKTTLQLKDEISKTYGIVANIPLAFALPVGIIENFGYMITRGFEQVFSPINNLTSFGKPNLPYYNYGMVFGARLKKEISQVGIKNPEFVGNMHNFIKQCVMLPAMIGYQFTKEELVATKDMWKLVSSKAGTLTLVDISRNGVRDAINCKTAAGYFENSWQGEIDRITRKYRETEYGKARQLAQYLRPEMTLPTVFDNNLKAVYGTTESAGTILRQQMMINSLSGYTSNNYGVARARMQQESSSILSGDLASLYIPMALAIFKCVSFAIFIFFVPLIIAGGITAYKGYLILILSLQLWPAINSVLNMIIGTYSNLASGSSLLVSYSTASTIASQSDTIVTIAGSMQAAVPMLAYWLTSIGTSGVAPLASGIISMVQGAASSAAGEMSTGNRSFDNISEGNTQRGIISANKTDLNTQYFEGANNTGLSDGTVATTFADGSQSFNSGSMHSSGKQKLSLDNSVQDSINENIEEGISLVESSRDSFSKAHASTFDKTSDYVSHLAQQESAGKNISYDEMGEQGKALQQAVNHTRQLQEQNGYGWNQAASTAMKGGISGSIGGLLSGGVDISMDASNSSNQVLNDGTTINRDNNINNRYDNIVRAAQNDTWARNNNIDTSYSDAVRSSYHNEQRAENQLAMNEDRLNSYHKARSNLQSRGASHNEDAYPEVEKRLAQKLGVSSQDAHRLVEEWDPEANKVWNELTNERVRSLMPSIQRGKQQLSSDVVADKVAKFNQQHNVEDQSEKVREVMSKEGKLSPLEVRQSMDGNRENIEQKTAKIRGENYDQYVAIKYYNESEEGAIGKRAVQYENDRIGKGKVGTAFGLIDGVGYNEEHERRNYIRGTPPTHKEGEEIEDESQKVKK